MFLVSRGLSFIFFHRINFTFVIEFEAPISSDLPSDVEDSKKRSYILKFQSDFKSVHRWLRGRTLVRITSGTDSSPDWRTTSATILS